MKSKLAVLGATALVCAGIAFAKPVSIEDLAKYPAISGVSM